MNKSIEQVNDTYAQWVREAAQCLSKHNGDAVSLFESSVPEPVKLLRRVVEKCFGASMTNKYKSVFTESNPYILEALSERYGVRPENILCTTGATGAIATIYRTFLNPGDHILVETPGFDIFFDFASVSRAKVDRIVRRAPDYAIDLEAISQKITPQTRFIVLSNLHNPTSALISETTLAKLADMASTYGASVIVDEVYRDYAGRGKDGSVGAVLRDNIISVSSLTKIYGLSTLRCGWIIAAPNILDCLRDVSDKFEFNTSKLAHAIAAEVLAASDEFDAYTHGVMDETRPIAAEALAHMQAAGLIEGEMPGDGCICFPRITGVENTRRLSQWLIANYGVYVVPGEYFQAPGHIRIGFAIAPEQLKTGLKNLERGLFAYSRLSSVRSSSA